MPKGLRFIPPNSRLGRQLRTAKGTGGKSDVEKVLDILNTIIDEEFSRPTKLQLEQREWNKQVEQRRKKSF